MQINYALVLSDFDTDAVKAAFTLYAEKCKAEVKVGNTNPHEADELRMQGLLKDIDTAEADAWDLYYGRNARRTKKDSP